MQRIRKIGMMSGLVGTLALGACTDPARFNSDDPNYNQNQGAIAGGIMGALIGSTIGDSPDENRFNTFAGAILGAGVGSLIGKQLDEQAAELRASMYSDQVTITNTGQSLIVTMPQDILFATNSTVVRPALRADLAALAQNLQAYPNSTVQVVGHTDNVGSAEYNNDLSLRRANAVATVLINSGVSYSRLSTLGLGESQPVATNLTVEGRAQNRRVEIIILPNT